MLIVLVAFIVTLLLVGIPIVSYFALRWFVRYCASREVVVRNDDDSPLLETVYNDDGSPCKDADGRIVQRPVMQPKPVLWCFVPENCTASLQRKANNLSQEGKGTKSTPASGSGIVDIIHNVSGWVLDRSSRDIKQWEMKECMKDVQGQIIEVETHRRGLMYALFGATWIGLNEPRWVKIREVRVSIDEQEVSRYKRAMVEWERNGLQGDQPRRPRYEARIHIYDTLFPYFTREHGVLVKGAETAGAYTLDFSLNFKYKEIFPGRARIELADPNAFITELGEQETNTLSGSHQPEYYLFADVPDEPEAKDTPLKDRKDDFVNMVKEEVAEQALEVVGLSIDKVVLYDIDMDEKQRELFELQEATKRKEQARILASEREIEVAENEALAAIARAEGEKEVTILNAEAAAEAKMLQNIADGDEIEMVEGAIDRLEHADTIRESLAYERNKTVTHFTKVEGGSQTVTPVGSAV